MAAKPNHFTLGLFVLGGLAGLVLLLLLVGGGSLFEPRTTVETYFDESVAGLEVGAPVKFRGVRVGSVRQIGISSFIYERDVPRAESKEYVVVRMELVGFSASAIEGSIEENVGRGLRVKTQLAGITGQLFIAANFEPNPSPPLPFTWKPAYPYVPSAPSLTNEILEGVQDFMASLDKARIDELAQNLNRLLVTLDATARDARMAELSAQTSATLVELRRLITDTRTIVERGEIDQTLRQLNTASGRLAALLDDPAFRTVPRDAAVIAEQLRQLSTSGELQRLAAQADAAATRANQILGSNEYDLRVAVEDLRASLENLRQLTETLRADPAALLFAPPPRPVVLPGAPR